MFEQLVHNLRQFFREHRIGIYATLSFHLVVIIIFLLYHINRMSYTDTAFLIDFSKEEEKIALQEKEERRKSFERELDKIVRPERQQELRNVAVDKADNNLRDDRNNNPSSIYEEARQVQERLDASRRAAQQQQGGDVSVASENNTPANTEVYKGPSVLSYDLGGRKAMRLPVPVYQCEGGGDVTVQVEVDRRGYVTGATVNANGSVNNNCLHNAALQAARTSRFAADANAPRRQKGHITYRFIKQ